MVKVSTPNATVVRKKQSIAISKYFKRLLISILFQIFALSKVQQIWPGDSCTPFPDLLMMRAPTGRFCINRGRKLRLAHSPRNRYTWGWQTSFPRITGLLTHADCIDLCTVLPIEGKDSISTKYNAKNRWPIVTQLFNWIQVYSIGSPLFIQLAKMFNDWVEFKPPTDHSAQGSAVACAIKGCSGFSFPTSPELCISWGWNTYKTNLKNRNSKVYVSKSHWNCLESTRCLEVVLLIIRCQWVCSPWYNYSLFSMARWSLGHGDGADFCKENNHDDCME